jgi:hypothetical protein
VIASVPFGAMGTSLGSLPLATVCVLAPT